MGMRAHTEELGLESVGVEVGPRGEIVTNGCCRTTNEHISAAGDVTGGWMLASTAAMQGRIAALSALGRPVDPMSLDAIAGTVFTRPEVAGVGLTESKAEEKGVRVAVTRQPLRANPRGLIAGQSDGMIKLVWDPDNGRVLGGSIVGYRASEVITTVALAVKAQLTVDTLAETGAVNPSVSESLQRCAERAANARMARGRHRPPASPDALQADIGPTGSGSRLDALLDVVEQRALDADVALDELDRDLVHAIGERAHAPDLPGDLDRGIVTGQGEHDADALTRGQRLMREDENAAGREVERATLIARGLDVERFVAHDQLLGDSGEATALRRVTASAHTELSSWRRRCGLRWASSRSARASIWRTRSRVTPSASPTCSSVRAPSPSRP